MSLNRLRRNFEERRLSLIETLQRQRDELELSKQHQLYGAIKEIESFLKAIDSLREEELDGTDFELKREGERPIALRANLAVKRAGDRTKTFFSAVAVGVNEKVFKGAKRAVSSTRNKVRIYKEIAKEVKARNKSNKRK